MYYFFRKTVSVFIILVTLFSTNFSLLYADAIISVTGTVPPQSNDFQFVFTPQNTSATVNQDTVLQYNITYGAQTSAGFTTVMTITATYTTDPSVGVNLLDYVTNSATSGYNGEHATIDPVNHKVTWNISIPKGVTGQVVSFQLKTNENYTGTNSVPLTIAASAKNQYTNIGNGSDTKNYVYDPALVTPTPTPTPNINPTATPTPGSGPTNTPEPNATATPIPTPTSIITGTLSPSPIISQPTTQLSNPQTTTITNMDVSQVTSNTITVTFTTSTPAPLTLHIGTSPNNLSQIVTTSSDSVDYTFALTGLLPETTYYIQAVGDGVLSDILTITTARESTPTRVAMQTVSFISSGVDLVGAQNRQSDQTGLATSAAAIVVLPTNQKFTVTFQLMQRVDVKQLVGIIKRQSVLGVNTFSSPTPDETQVPIIEKSPGVYTLNLVTPPSPGIYDLLVQINDVNGNVVRQRIGVLNIRRPFTVIDKANKNPISHARVLLYRYDNFSHKYLRVSSSSQGFTNPTFTNTQGIAGVILSPGQYKADVSALGYTPQIVTFSIGGSDSDQFPLIQLVHNPFNLKNFISSLQNTFSDTLATLTSLLDLIKGAYSLLISISILAGILFIMTCLWFWFDLHHQHTFIHTYVYQLFVLFMSLLISITALASLITMLAFGFGATYMTLIISIASLALWIICLHTAEQ